MATVTDLFNKGGKLSNGLFLSETYAVPVEVIDEAGLISALSKLPSETKLKGHAEQVSYVDKVVRDIRATFGSFRATHDPSEDHWRGLREIVENIDGQLDGTIAPKFYLSGLPTGMGKTTALICSVREARKRYPEKSWLVLLSQIDEIDRIVEGMQLPEDQYACLTSRDTTNAKGLGSKNANSAPVLFTTQKRIENAALKKSKFRDMSEFLFNGKPRDVRVWDETMILSKALTLDEQDIDDIASKIPLRENYLFYRDLKSWAAKLPEYPDGETITVIDLEAYGFNVESFVAMFDEDRKDKALALALLSGRSVRTRKVPRDGMTCLSYVDIVPEDIFPLLGLDASGGILKSYEDWEKRGNLVRLHAPTKRYPILIRVHDLPAGKDKQKTSSKFSAALVDKAVASLNQGPRRKLFCSHKHKPGRIDWPKVLRERFFGNVEFCHWGVHFGTNKFQDCEHIVVAGMHIYNVAVHEAQARGSRQMSLEETIPPRELDGYIAAEAMHNLFQLIGRGAVRRCIGDSCPEGIVVDLITTIRRGGGLDLDLLKRTFPGATIIVEKPDLAPKGRVKEALDLIRAELKKRPKVYFAEIRDPMKIDRRDFQRDIVDHYTFKEALRRMTVEVVYQGAGTKGSYFTPYG